MGIKVALISRDQEIARLCRATLVELFGPDFTLTVAPSREPVSESDLCIWDFAPGETEILLQPADLDGLQSHFFLVWRKDLAALRECVGSPVPNLLLKPLMPATLRAFLGETCRRWRDLDTDFAARRLRAERDEMLQCLIQANLRLQEYDQDRTTFLARSLHDLRSPLTAISGYCALLLCEDLGSLSTEQREVLERMEFSVRRLSRLANSMFQLSVFKNAEQKLALQQADIRECVDKALQELTPFIDEKRLSVNVEIEPSDLLWFDKASIEQVLVNLLDNACKFTPRGGTIDIKGSPFFWDRRIGEAARLDPSVDRRVTEVRAPNSFRVDVRDSGPSVPVEHLDKIFEEYTSYSGGQDRSGGGLGLAVCRMIARQHQGRIWADNGPAGTVFSFVLPYRRNNNTAPQVAVGSEEHLHAMGGMTEQQCQR